MNKMEPTDEMCKSLLKWLQTYVPNKSRSILEVCDGVAMLEALIQIDPEYFSKLEPKIKKDVGANWRLKVSNLKKIAEAVIEYYQDVLRSQLVDVARPDVNKVGETNDPIQLAKLLRLILGCAINCDRSHEYIKTIMEMDEYVQRNLMQAIQQLEELTGGPGRSGLSLLILDSDSRVNRLVQDLQAANEAKENLVQQCQSYEMQIQKLIDEKQVLISEAQALRDKEAKSPNARKQIELLKEELFKAEVMRDDFKAKISEQEKEIHGYQEKIAELQLAANDTSRLKDEIDALSESAAKVKELEMVIASYKKKLENYTDIKKKAQQLEEKNIEYLQKILQYEEELSKNNTWKSQCESYKQQLGEAQQKLDEETQRADKAQFNCEQLEARLLALQSEKERLVQERDSLREDNEELRLGQPKGEHLAAMSQELTPTEMKERLRFLERENKALRSSSQEIESKQVRLDSALNRIEKLQQQNRAANQTILKLEAQLEELNKNQSSDQSNDSIIKEHKQKIISLQEALTAKENELQIMQAKYSRSLEKAREVAQQLEPKSNGSIDTSLRQAHMKEKEERLIVTAFHHLGLSCQREAIGERLAILNAGQGQSFLARQRQPTPRKQFQRYKSK